ncbi:MAG TPA: hypothetical protein VGJ26_02015 [Pirellulales bacterium]
MTERARHHRVLLDTGPLVAIVAPNEVDHELCVATLPDVQPPLLTCWPVLTEAAWLLRRDHAATKRMLQGAQTGFFTLLPLMDIDLSDIEVLHSRYSDLNTQLADLALLHLAQRENIDTVFTLDRRDFGVFRLKGKRRLRLIPEIE